MLTTNALWLLEAVAQDIILYELYNLVQAISIYCGRVADYHANIFPSIEFINWLMLFLVNGRG